MKKTIYLAIAALFVSASINAQSTVDSIAAKYQLLPMPEQWTNEKKFPVLGTYQLQSTTDTSASVMITMDSANKGIVWVEGLPQGKFKAYLKKSPSTYRILSQKTEAGKQISEGTLHYDTVAKTLHVALGAPFNDADPMAIFALNPATSMDAAATEQEVKVKTKTSTSKTKTKAKVSYYTANKLDMAMTTSTNVIQQQ